METCKLSRAILLLSCYMIMRVSAKWEICPDSDPSSKDRIKVSDWSSCSMDGPCEITESKKSMKLTFFFDKNVTDHISDGIANFTFEGHDNVETNTKFDYDKDYELSQWISVPIKVPHDKFKDVKVGTSGTLSVSWMGYKDAEENEAQYFCLMTNTAKGPLTQEENMEGENKEGENMEGENKEGEDMEKGS